MNLIKAIILWLAFLTACFLPAFAETPSAPENGIWEIFNIGYDAPIAEAIPTYDSPVQLAFAYDNAPNHRVGDERRSALGTCPLFGQNAEFKAAEETGLTLTTHATEQMAARGVTEDMIDEALENGITSAGNTPGTLVFDLNSSVLSTGTGARVVISTVNRTVITVVNKGSSFKP